MPFRWRDRYHPHSVFIGRLEILTIVRSEDHGRQWPEWTYQLVELRDPRLRLVAGPG